MTYYRSKDVLFWYITLTCLAISSIYIWMPDGNIYEKWFDTIMYITFIISLILHPIAIINMLKHKTIEYI